MSERATVSAIMRWLRAQPQCWCYKAADAYTSGVPDIIACWRGRFVGMEVKSKRGRVRPLQEYNIKKIREAGGAAGVIRSLAEAKALLQEGTTDDEA